MIFAQNFYNHDVVTESMLTIFHICVLEWMNAYKGSDENKLIHRILKMQNTYHLKLTDWWQKEEFV